MLNMFRMDLRRLLRTKSLYISTIVLMAVVIIASIAINAVCKYGSVWDIQDVLSGFSSNTDMKTEVYDYSPSVADAAMLEAMKVKLRSFMTLEVLASAPFISRLSYMLIALVCVLFVSKDYITAYLKNLLLLPQAKIKWLISKIIILPVIIIFMYLGITLAALIGQLILGNPFPSDFMPLISYMAKTLVSSISFGLFSIFIVVLLQKRTGAIIICLLMSFNFQRLIYTLIDITKALPFKLSDYGLMTLTSRIGIDTPLPDTLLPVAGAITGLSLVLSFVLIRRRDLKM